MTIQIAVIGCDENEHSEISPHIIAIAEEVGREIARRKAVLICGGRGGIMKAVAKGVFEEGGITIGILPSLSKSEANSFIKVAIPSGLGPIIRGSLIVRAADVIIAIGGGVGTLSEITSAYADKKPIIGLRGTGGWTDKLIDSYIDDRKLVKILGEDSPKEAVIKAIQLAQL